MNYRQIKAMEKINKERILKCRPNIPDTSGIYTFTRSEDGFRYAYVGQAKHLLTRIAQHLSGYQHIDLSLKKHGLWSLDNMAGWNIGFRECAEAELDELEKLFVLNYAGDGYQLLNKTSGGQGKGKKAIVDQHAKGYQEGLRNGYAKAQKEIAHLFKLHLVCGTKKEPPNKLQAKALEKFNKFIDV